MLRFIQTKLLRYEIKSPINNNFIPQQIEIIKEDMNKQHEKAMLDLQRSLKTQDFKSMEEMQDFINKNVVGQKIPSFDKEALSFEEQAQDLVYQAREEDNQIVADQFLFQALKLDADCVEAHELMGDLSTSPMTSYIFYQTACLKARKKLGEKFFKENKGHFWGIHETRPFMRCLKNVAECLYMLNQKEEALNIFLELLELNTNDNQGNRDQAGLYCLELGKYERFEKLHQDYIDDIGAFHRFNFALFCFITKGDSDESLRALVKAREINKHVVNFMLSKKEMPLLPDHYGVGDKNEAIFYCTFAKDIWHKVPEAIRWLERIYYKR